MIIGICGGTGSGKTTIARQVVERGGEENVILIEQDSYYLNLSEIPLDERKQANFDHPGAVDFDLFVNHLARLKNGETVDIPHYDFSTHTRADQMRRVESKPVVLIEGILLFAEPRIVELLDVKIFIDTPDDMRLLRRIKRDMKERGRTLDQILTQYEKTIRPMHEKFVNPSKMHADIVIPHGGKSAVAFEFLWTFLNKRLMNEKIFATR